MLVGNQINTDIKLNEDDSVKEIGYKKGWDSI